MTGDPYEVHHDPYCYENTSVLRNKADLRDQALLDDFELEMLNLRAQEPLPDGACDPSHYRAVHHHLFQDVYGWAGEYRTVRTAKGGNSFCYPENIELQINGLFAKLAGATRDSFIDAVTYFLSELNVIHCFREGNGRAQLTFVDMLASRAGHPLNLELIERETYVPAIIESFSGGLAPLRVEIFKLYGGD